jgi:NADPH:quinone reductase-like Zn-dependent oxidoreductase
MKAVVYNEYGSPDVLRVEDVPAPKPRDDEILIRVRAAEVTKGDCEMRRFSFQVNWFWLPLRIAFGLVRPRRRILGGYFAGEVASAGKGVSTFREGDRVFGAAKLRLGAHAEFVSLPATYAIVPMPANASFEEAAAVPLGGLNALHFMTRAQVRAGDTVLVNGAGGSIGVYAVQIAKALGADVTAVDRAAKEELLRGLGADGFIDYAREDFTRSGRAFDVIFSVVAGSPFAGCIKALNPGGRYVMANPRLSDMLRSVQVSRFSDKKAIFAFAGETKDELLALKDMIEHNEIRPVVDRAYPLAQAAEAHGRVEAEQRLGPVVLSPG